MQSQRYSIYITTTSFNKDLEFCSYTYIVIWTYTMLERIYKPHYDYQNFSPLANGTDSNRQKYAILQTHWH